MADLLHEGVWYDQRKYEAAESVMARLRCPPSPITASFAQISADIEASLKAAPPPPTQDAASTCSAPSDADRRVKKLEEENARLNNVVKQLTDRVAKLETQVFGAAASQPSQPAPSQDKKASGGDDDNDDEFDLFGSDEEDEEEDKIKAERIAAYQERKAKKTAVVAKSNIILSVKPWDDETDMKEIERVVRSIEADGLVWGASKLVPLAYGIHTLQISCVVEDDKVGTDFLEESITAFEDLIQSMDVVAFNKV